MQKNLAPLLIVLAVLFAGVAGIFMLSNQTVKESDINFNPTIIPSPTGGIIETTTPTAVATPINMDDFQTTQTGLRIHDEASGSGVEVKSGDTVTVHYAGYLENGTKFDSSYDRKTPFSTQIGVGNVIKGWDEGIVGMKVGGKRKLIIPPNLGYGAQGAGEAIPPNSILLFDVELLDVK